VKVFSFFCVGTDVKQTAKMSLAFYKLIWRHKKLSTAERSAKCAWKMF
jgi:hypothetical protein